MRELEYSAECEFIKRTIKEAYKTNGGKNDFDRMEKKTFDIVTTDDYSIEKYIINCIKERYPNDRILSEEMNSKTLIEGRTWTIDPIDGTYNYANGIPLFGIQCSMFDQGRVAACAIYLPTVDEMYFAVVGGGAYLNEHRIVVKKADLDKCIVSFGDFPHSRPNDTYDEKKVMSGILDEVARVRMFGAACIDFAYLASGKTNGVVIFTKNKWDISPGILLCSEAGAIIVGEKEEYSYDSRVVIAASQQDLATFISSFVG